MFFRLLLLMAFFALAPMARAELYEAYYANGDSRPLNSVRNLLDVFPHHGDGRKLLEGDNPIRTVRHRTSQSELKPPFVELANGDCLPGKVISRHAAQAGGFPPAHFVVQAETWPLATASVVRIRESQVRRIVFDDPPADPWEANRIATRDGRLLRATKLAFSENGLRALGDFGVGQPRFTTLDFSEVAELCLAAQPVAEAMASDSLLAIHSGDEWLATVGDAQGGRYTAPTSRSRVEQVKLVRRPQEPLVGYTQLQPLWSLDPLAIELEQVISISYRKPSELPLAAFPTEETGEAKSIHRWTWRRNANVVGEPLAVGKTSADTGFGVHASQALLVSLPPGAVSISGAVGIDRVVGDGGCVKAFIRRDSVQGGELWKSDFLLGGQTAATFENVAVRGVEKIVLVADAAATDFPEGADPLDIGDHVDWLAPMVTVDLEAIHPQPPYDNWLPELAGWNFPENERSRLKLKHFWNEQSLRWNIALDIDHHGDLAEKPFRLTRREKISLANAFFHGKVTRSGDANGSHVVMIEIDGEKANTTMNGGLHTTYLRNNRTGSRHWIFAEYAGKEVDMAMVFTPDTKKSDKHPEPVAVIAASLLPLVRNLPSSGEPISPDVALESLKPTAVENIPDGYEFKAGKLTNGEPLALRNWPMNKGIGAPTGGRLTYALDPKWKRFVAVIGLAEGSTAAGPYQVVVDGDILWESIEPNDFGRNTQGEQIDVALPDGAREIILKMDGREAFGAWAHAGFVEE